MNALRSALVIGGGPAGATVATLLARAGTQVTLIESAKFPRIKVCGEFITPAATDTLHRILPPAALAALGAARIDTFTLECGNRSLSKPLASPSWSLSRDTLDTALIAQATTAGGCIRQPETVRSATFSDSHAIAHLDTQTLTADIIIHADGSGRHDPLGPLPHAKAMVGRKCHANFPAGLVRGVQIRSGSNAYVGSIVVESGVGTIALVSRPSLVARFEGNGDAMLRHVWPLWNPAWRTSDWKSSPVPRGGPITGGHPRSLRIGNAAAAVDPIGGEGIGLALWSAATLADMLLSTPGDLESLARLHHTFRAAYAVRLRTRHPACRLAAEVLMRPRIIRALWPLFSLRNGLLDTWLTLSGKP